MAYQRQSAQADQFPSFENKGSLVAAGLTIEGKIDGLGHVRIAGRFNGEVHVRGDLTVEQGAQISGKIRAENIVVGGEVEGNIHAKARVELSESGVLTGDLKASSLTVAAGSRMRGKVEFGWDKGEAEVKMANLELLFQRAVTELYGLKTRCTNTQEALELVGVQGVAWRPLVGRQILQIYPPTKYRNVYRDGQFLRIEGSGADCQYHDPNGLLNEHQWSYVGCDCTELSDSQVWNWIKSAYENLKKDKGL